MADREPAPHDPIAAVTHADPYRYYAALRAGAPLFRDEGLGLWVASRAAVVEEVLTHPACRVRPADEPVPRALLGSPAGDVFRQLVRMNDGNAHCPFKHAVTATLDGIDPPWLQATADHWAARLAADGERRARPAFLTDFSFALPVYVVGQLLGLPETVLPEVAAGTPDLVRGLFPGGSAEEVERGKKASAGLLALVTREMGAASDGRSPFLLHRLAEEARRVGRDDTALVAANAIGFLAQAYDATAALISATVLTLARQPDLLDAATRSPGALAAVVDEVVRIEAPVQNTRRFLHEAAEVGGLRLPAGGAVLVVLAAANRDPHANPHPDRVDLTRASPRVFTFGVGPHACPGRGVATAVAGAAVRGLLSQGIDLHSVETDVVQYRPSANCRMPLLRWKERS